MPSLPFDTGFIMSDTKKDTTNLDLDDFLDLDFGVKNDDSPKADLDKADVKADTTDKADTKKTDTTLDKSSTDKSSTNKPSLDKTDDKADKIAPVSPKADPVASKKPSIDISSINKALDKKEMSDSQDILIDLDDESTPKSMLDNLEVEPEPVPAAKQSKSLFNKPKKADNPKKGGLLGKKDKKAKSDTAQSPLLANSKKLNRIVIGAIIALIAVAVLLYMLLSGGDKPAEPVTPPPPPASTSAPAPANEPPADTDTSMGASEEAGDIISTDGGAGGADLSLPSFDMDAIITPDEILKSEIPTDPALIKEEIDRLTDIDRRLSDQEKSIKAELEIMDDIARAKDEQIALLEAQIAELQNSGN